MLPMAPEAPQATSARSMPMVSLSPPAPGLSWVSEITTGFVAPSAMRIASRTPSSGDQTGPAKSASAASMASASCSAAISAPGP